MSIDEQAEPAGSARRKSRLWRWGRRIIRVAVVLLLVGLVAGFVAVMITNHLGERARRRMIKTLNEHDIPEFSTFLPSAVGDTNDSDGTRFYLGAFALILDDDTTGSDLPYLSIVDEPELCEQVHPELLNNIDAYLKRHDDFYQLMEKAGQYDKFYYRRDEASVWDVITGGSNLSNATRRLQLKCLFHQGRDELDEAVAAYEAVAHLSRTIDHAPLLLEAIVSCTTRARSIRMVEQVLSRSTLDIDRLQRLEKQAQGLATHEMILKACQVELASSRARLYEIDILAIRTRYEGHLSFSRMAEQLANSFDIEDDDVMAQTQVGPDWSGALYALCPGIAAFALTNEITPALTAYKQLKAYTNSVPKLYSFVQARPSFAGLGYTVVTAAETAIKVETQLSLMACALRIEQFRIANGAWPETLDDLDDVPIEPITNQAPGFERTDDGWIIYSRGIAPRPFSTTIWNEHFTFRLFDPHIRNSKPPVLRTREQADQEFEENWRRIEGRVKPNR